MLVARRLKHALDEPKKNTTRNTHAPHITNDQNNPHSERELAAVKVSADDVKVLAAEAEVDAKAAERRLRECGGDLEAALESYL